MVPCPFQEVSLVPGPFRWVEYVQGEGEYVPGWVCEGAGTHTPQIWDLRKGWVFYPDIGHGG